MWLCTHDPQHLEQTPGFDANNVQILVLDEADRILDMGFRTQLDGILRYLPKDRQTLLFSATQTKSVKDLARLSLREPEYLAVHAEDTTATPLKLHQNYIICNLQDKLDVLFSFLKSHLKSKIIVFMSTCAQVRFVHECFKGMQPGIPLIALHGKIKQEKRTIVFLDFARRKSAVLFATDIAARGLDFPDVDWVFQLDAPEDTAMYIHRVGRTARYQSGGRALMVLMPTEEKAVVEKLKSVGIDLKKLSVNKKQYTSVATQAASLLVSRPECRLLAKKAFTGYLRSLQNLPSTGHQVHPVDLLKLPVDAFSISLGLAFTPPLPLPPPKSATGDDSKSKKNVNRALDKLKKQIKESKERRKAKLAAGSDASSEEIDSDTESNDERNELKKLIKTHGKKKARLLMNNRSLRPVAQHGDVSLSAENDDTENADDLFIVKQVHNICSSDVTDGLPISDSAAPSARAIQRKLLKIRANGASAAIDAVKTKRIRFDDRGSAVNIFGAPQADMPDGEAIDLKDRVRSHMEAVKRRIDAARAVDVTLDRERVREMHKKDRNKRRDENKEGDAAAAILASPIEEFHSGEEDDTYLSDNNSGADGSSMSNFKKRKQYFSETEDGTDMHGGPRSKINKNNNSNAKHVNELNIDDQEQLALKLLKNG
jgi:ATP-dependent RNA helicase DDX10/DBP4